MADGDPTLADLARETAKRPNISVPTVVLIGESGLLPSHVARDKSRFTGPYHMESLAGIGHNVPQEAPAAMAGAVLRLMQ
jgi:pimeloyl-ACP methyl ester carboxylesterase